LTVRINKDGLGWKGRRQKAEGRRQKAEGRRQKTKAVRSRPLGLSP
jgi:hypothetical protein